MDEQETSIFCDHCNEKVSKSTFRRHQLLDIKERHQRSAKRQKPSDPDSSSDNESNIDACERDKDIEVEIDSCENTPQLEEAIDSEVIHENSNSQEVESDLECFDSNESSESTAESSGEEHYVKNNPNGGNYDFQENWDEVSSQIFDKDITPSPIPHPEHKKSKIQKINSLVFWFVYFLLLWQTSCKISDNGLAWFLQFFFQFLKVINIEISSDFITELITVVPSSIYMLRQFINHDRDAFDKFVVCPKCTKLYSYDNCLQLLNNKVVPKTCSKTFMSRGREKRCDSALVKKVILNGNKEDFYPIVYYCYNSIVNELECLLQQKEIPERCEEWRKRPEGSELKDVYDGQIWKDFQTFKGKEFLKAPRNYAFMLNFDFFQPFKHRKDYSVGVLYLVLLNLPRSIRFKWENVIVIGIIPSMDSEPKNLNEFLKPTVKELQVLWKGIRLKSSYSSFPLTFRAALLAISADIPAARKLCGFKSHSAYHGCSRCLKFFPGGFGEKRDYSGFDRENWPKRTSSHHLKIAEQIKTSKTIKDKKELGKEHGIAHWTVLLQLEYFDVVRFCTVDPMHNLFLGTAKYVFKYWDTNGIISKSQMSLLEKRINEMDVPSDIGRLPKKISSNYGSFTAAQWKNWTLIYSIFSLKGVIGEQHFSCWQTFVLACKYLCKPALSSIDLDRADFLLMKFCREFERLYGKSAITPNMHLHCHLKQIIKDHGPVYSFWCFGFERYNGIMGSITTNKRSVELQLMRKLMLSRFLDQVQLPDQYAEHFQPLMKHGPSTPELAMFDNVETSLLNMSTACPVATVDWSQLSHVVLPHIYKLKAFDTSDLNILVSVYKALYTNREILLEALGENVKIFSYIKLENTTYGSKLECRSVRSSHIYASWTTKEGNLNLETISYFAGQVEFYFCHSLKLGENYVNHIFACVSWYMPHDDPDLFGNPTKTWKTTELVDGGPSRFLPVQRIHCRYAVANIDLNGQKRLVTIPIERGDFSSS